MSTVIWIAGWNLGGYLPEMSPFLTVSWESGRDFLAEEIDRHKSSLYDGLKTHKYFEFGREEWSAQQVLDYAEQQNDTFPCVDESTAVRDEYVVLTDSDKETLVEIAQCEEMLSELSALEADTEWDGCNKYTNNWLHITDRSANDIPADLEGEELEYKIDELNEVY